MVQNRISESKPPASNGDSRQIVLDPDVAEVFKSDEAVNHALRNLITLLAKNKNSKVTDQYLSHK